jgi:hypothetical protein
MNPEEAQQIINAARKAGRFDKQYEAQAKRIPASIRTIILQENWIQTAINVQEQNTPMEFLFEQYAMYVTDEYNDFACAICRQHVLEEWKYLESFLKALENGE